MLCSEPIQRKPQRGCIVASAGLKSSKIEGLGFLKALLSGVVASGGSKSSNIEGLEFFKALLSGVVASGGSNSSKIEGLGFVKPLLRGVVASGGSKSSKIEGLAFFKPLLRDVVASGGSNSSTIKSLGLLFFEGVPPSRDHLRDRLESFSVGFLGAPKRVPKKHSKLIKTGSFWEVSDMPEVL